MSEDFGSRWQEGAMRARARNVAELRGLDLEGPGSERRLARLQRRFRKLEFAASKDNVRQAWIEPVRLGLATFVGVVAIGLIVSFGLPRMQEIELISSLLDALMQLGLGEEA